MRGRQHATTEASEQSKKLAGKQGKSSSMGSECKAVGRKAQAGKPAMYDGGKQSTKHASK